MPATAGQSEISVSVEPAEFDLIRLIVDRGLGIAAQERIPGLNRMHLMMDIIACHANGCPLQLEALLAADDFDFTHDVFGIVKLLDRSTGQLGANFTPRFAQPRPQAA